MAATSFVSTFYEPQNIEQGMLNFEVFLLLLRFDIHKLFEN